MIIDTDKNLGLAALDTADYQARAEEELQTTHHRLPDSADPLADTRAAIEAELLLHADSLPTWASRLVTRAVETHPRTDALYRVPNFRVTLKVHKVPITGNQCWITQPLAQLEAALLQPYVEAIPVWTRDTDQVNRLIDDTTVGPDDLLITYDVVRLYPSIPHELCYTLLRRHLEANRCPYTDYLIAALRIILNQIYCSFDGGYFKQFIGFATGIACGAEVANLFLYILTRFVFNDFADSIRTHRRYIDDGFVIWRGTRARAEELFTRLNAICPDIQLTFEISSTTAVFLDLTIFKGDRWRTEGRLDSCCYQKPVNQYLYTPFSSEHPQHCYRGIVHGELRRYIKRCTAFADYLAIATQFRYRLAARGYPEKFLAAAFKTGPRYRDRPLFLNPVQRRGNDLPAIVFSTVFSSRLQNSKLSRAIFSHREWLPRHFADVPFLTAWKVARKVGGALISFAFPKPLPGLIPRPATDGYTATTDGADQLSRSQHADNYHCRGPDDTPTSGQANHPSHSDEL
eukprot:SAG22_NODE_549_length_9239_cov_7.477899_8_plen_516_part_00